MKFLLVGILANILLITQVHAFSKGHATPTPSLTPLPTATVSPSPSSSHNGNAWWKTENGVDLRSCDSPVENQTTPYCTAFSFAGVLSTMLCDKQRLSIEHPWSYYKQYSVDAAAAKAIGHNITIWDEWPESKSAKSDYLSFAKHQITGMKLIDTDDDIEAAKAVLDSGRPVYIGMSVPSDVASCYSIIRKNTGVTKGGHALEIVGYGTDQKVGGGMYWIIKNSWGVNCADNGYFYMPVSVCDLKSMYCIMYEPLGVK